MGNTSGKTVLILGANSDVAREMLRIYGRMGHHLLAASRSVEALRDFVSLHPELQGRTDVLYWDAEDFASHAAFYAGLPAKPEIVVYAAGFLRDQQAAMVDWEGAFRMMKVHYAGAVSMLNLIVSDTAHTRLEQIIGLSSLSGVRGRKSNFIYGSTKSAFTQYLAGLRQLLAPRKVRVNVIVAGYIRSKMTAGLNLPENLMLEPEFIARASVHAGRRFVTVPGWKWKLIYQILKRLPENLVARLP